MAVQDNHPITPSEHFAKQILNLLALEADSGIGFEQLIDDALDFIKNDDFALKVLRIEVGQAVDAAQNFRVWIAEQLQIWRAFQVLLQVIPVVLIEQADLLSKLNEQ
jgi:hypothetical protein